MMCVCVSIGTWAQQDYQIEINHTWRSNSTNQKVAKIYLHNSGCLTEALAALNDMNYDYQVLYISGAGDGVDYGHQDLTDADLGALSTITCETIDLQNMNTANPFVFSNSHVKNVILPDGWDKNAVQAAGKALAADNADFGSCLSQNGNGITYKDDSGNSQTGAAVVAYVSKGNTLYNAMIHTYFDSKPNKKLRDENGEYLSQWNEEFPRVKSLTLLGYPSASDFSTTGDWDANGHFVPNYEPFEFSTSPNARLDENGEVKADRASYVDGTAECGGLLGCKGLIVLDLRDAIITEEYYNDLTLTWTGVITKETQQVWIPTTSQLKTIPADFLSGDGYSGIREICIPANIENIRTRAFASPTHNLVHVWTTGTNDDIIYDNGAWITDGKDDTTPENDVYHFGMSAIDEYDGVNNVTYGTYTFSENIKLIESNAFSTGYRVKDVYNLAVNAPECHVDAFTSVMYNGFNTYDPSAITEGIIDREAYTNNKKSRMYMTMLHYPRECQTPNVQRYTDPTREYNVATGLRDGRGNNLYFPNQSEFTIAYAQGTSGYLWNAWENKRTEWGDMEIASPQGFLDPHSTDNQTLANTNWENNPNENKNDRSFYDVTLDGMNNSTLTAPSGLEPYYNTIWEDAQLYPQAKSVTSTYIYYRDDNGDYVKDASNANLFRDYAGSADDALERYSRKQDIGYYSCSDGRFVQDYTWTKDEAGRYILDGEYTLNTTGGGAYVLDYTWVRDDANGTHYHPLVSTAFPGNEWGELPNDFNNPTDYWYATFRYNSDPNGEYVKVYDDYYTDETVPSLHASVYEQNKAAGMTYSREPLGYSQCTNNEDVKNHKYDLFVVGDTYALWTSDVKDFVNGQKFARNPIAGEYREYNPSTDEGCDRYDITGNGFVLAVSPADDSKQHYTKSYVANSYREFDSSRDKTDEPLYCYGECDFVSETPITYTVQNDYRGWHQFVLAAYATNRKTPLEPVRSFISDCDWWTICVPYDLKYSDMVMFFGTEADKNNGKAKIPYLSKLMYVIRDQKNGMITLMFSKNLMEYKETMTATNHVHGTINDTDASGKYTDVEIARDPVILHAGVPYLIKPNMTKNADGKYDRQFDIFADKKADLYSRLHAAATLKGHEQMNLIYNGEYTVPAYVIGEGSEKTVDEKKITNRDGSEFTYKSGKIKYFGEQRDYKISDDFTYTFVGTYYNSVMPQFCYFLGWDKTLNNGQGGAAFWYNRVEEKDAWNWNNETSARTSTQRKPSTRQPA